MNVNWAHAGPSIVAAFLASLVEFVEALTVVLAIGVVRGWRGALLGSAAGVAALLGLVLLAGRALTHVPLGLMQLAVGTLLLLFGMRWLRKAMLRSAGVLALHDENAAYASQTESLRRVGARSPWDMAAVVGAFKITMLEGLEVIFIVIAVGAAGTGLLLPASAGALAALVLVLLLGLIIHRPLASVPENALKFAVGVLLAAFGTFWVGEGIRLAWPGRDWSILALVTGFLLTARLGVGWCRSRAAGRMALSSRRETAVHWTKAILAEIFGLFVDDGSFAAVIVLWVGTIWLARTLLRLPRAGGGVILFAGLAIILVENATRRSRRQPSLTD